MVEARTHVFRASLSPKVCRDFEILSAKNLYDLAEAIIDLFGFDLDHAFGFYSKLTGRLFDSPVKYELFADIGESEAHSVKRTQIVEAFPTVGAKMTFLYDYGDNWQFRIEVFHQWPELVVTPELHLLDDAGILTAAVHVFLARHLRQNGQLGLRDAGQIGIEIALFRDLVEVGQVGEGHEAELADHIVSGHLGEAEKD